MAGRRPSAPPPRDEVRDADWYARELTAEGHVDVAFIDVDMTEAVNVGSVFEDCMFRGVRFNVSTHTNAAFLRCTFSGCSFFDATFTGCKLVGSTFTRCSFSSTKVEGGDWSFVSLEDADLRTASFTDVRMREVDLGGVRADGAVLRNVDLSGASLRATSFVGADLRGSDLSTIDPSAVELRGAVVTWEQAAQIATALGLDVRPE